MISYHVYSGELKQTEIGAGFFPGWSNPPSKEKHGAIWEKSYQAVLAADEKEKKIVGFITAISDEVLSAYLPFWKRCPNTEVGAVAQP